MLLGLAVYNGVLLDAAFPHALYKKLLARPLGLPDLADLRCDRAAQHQEPDNDSDDSDDWDDSDDSDAKPLTCPPNPHPPTSRPRRHAPHRPPDGGARP